MATLVKDLNRSMGEAGMDGAILTSYEAKAHRLASDIERIRERSKGGKSDQRSAIDRDKDAMWR